MGIEFIGWDEAAKILKALPDASKEAMDQAMKEEAEFMQARLVAKLEAGVSPSRSALSVALGNTGPPLAGLAPYVIVKKVGDAYIVGIEPKGGSSGYSMADIAAANEEGRSYTTQMSDKQRRWFFAKLRDAGLSKPRIRGKQPPSSAGTVFHVTIPKRAWLQPTVDKYAEPAAVSTRVTATVAEVLRKKFGW